ncbi:MAG: hypothetical protein EBS68_11430, partial [Rhodobacteraceae bacterium]|nr:hypothetical protein [Paracoccaceae bacterium]
NSMRILEADMDNARATIGEAMVPALQAVTGAVVPVLDAFWAMFMGAVTLSGGMLCYTLGSRVVPAAQLALLSNVEVLLAPFWVWLFLGETATLTTLTGGAILLVAVTLNAVTSVRGSSRAAERA